MTEKEHKYAIGQTQILREEARRIAEQVFPYTEEQAYEMGLSIEHIRGARDETYDYALLALIDGKTPGKIKASITSCFPEPEKDPA